ncbi:hypothetical protein JTE90_027262 [Oedothorax gibbosus]|uniref:Large ribosomal subunit protein mL43 n=1 Tax=Oedothorax gibbosus TaxID=931172 RepID=A0AAV6VXN1_9ARAC|nr:hypothetical protein JTE90_027262 [Oedothorax gibbosus]
MSNFVNPSTFLKSVLHNGTGRYVCQLQRITFKFSKTHGGSNGLRDYIEKELMNFVKSNPGVVVYLQPRRIGPPSATAEYLNGETHYHSFPKYRCEDIVKWVESLRTRSGFPISRFIKNIHTDSPSVQGVWTPFTHKPTSWNVTEFPNEELSKAETFFPCATEQLLEISKQFENVSVDDEDDKKNTPVKLSN